MKLAPEKRQIHFKTKLDIVLINGIPNCQHYAILFKKQQQQNKFLFLIAYCLCWITTGKSYSFYS